MISFIFEFRGYFLSKTLFQNCFRYKTSNGIEVEEKGSQKEIVGENGEKVFGTVSSGKYSYIVDDGSGQRKKVTVTWTADENGFRPVITYSDDYETKTVIP